jgi:GT2 family glycosyltransferase
MATPRVSVVLCSRETGKMDAAAAMYARVLEGVPHEIVLVPDATSMAEGYNRGIASSSGDVIILSHDDVTILSDDFAARLESHLSSFDIVGVAGTSRLTGPAWTEAGVPYLFGQVAHPFREGPGYILSMYGVPRRVVGEIQALDGLFIALHRRVAEAFPFDPQRFDGFHLYDLDFTLRAYRGGFRIGVAGDLLLSHASWGSYDENWEAYAQRFMRTHGADLARGAPCRHNWATVHVQTKDELLVRMTPSYWDPLP